MINLEFKELFRVALERDLDAMLSAIEFRRAPRSFKYHRHRAESTQTIDVRIEKRPRDQPEALAAVYPMLEVRMPAVGALAQEMTGHDETLLSPFAASRLRQPIEFTAAKAAHARWFVLQPETPSSIVAGLKSFLETWTIPFLNEYASPADVCRAYDRDDKRTMNDLNEKLRVAAAMILCDRAQDALAVMERYFGKPGPRRQYKVVFEYLAARGAVR